jgi:hypothetical protein
MKSFDLPPAFMPEMRKWFDSQGVSPFIGRKSYGFEWNSRSLIFQTKVSLSQNFNAHDHQ